MTLSLNVRDLILLLKERSSAKRAENSLLAKRYLLRREKREAEASRPTMPSRRQSQGQPTSTRSPNAVVDETHVVKWTAPSDPADTVGGLRRTPEVVQAEIDQIQEELAAVVTPMDGFEVCTYARMYVCMYVITCCGRSLGQTPSRWSVRTYV